MRTISVIFIGFIFYLNSIAQSDFYLKPTVGIVWNSYENSNGYITGNEDVVNIFWDNDWIFELLSGYKFENNLILESGFIYHNATNRYHLNNQHFSTSNNVGGSSVSLGEGFLCIPLNGKYSINIKNEKLKILPYFGVTWSTHKINSSPYMTYYDIIFSQDASFVPLDTSAIIKVYRPSKNNILINYGIEFEYQILDNIIFTLSGNLTSGFRDMNIIDVDVITDDKVESGKIKFLGNKFYLSGGLKIPFGHSKRE